ncbi:hypothetical protein HDU98_005712 [Podochytrium sp. JEL0797]|nr:hypothetical protein HDU98_005712 [Podochytrium sp. JEL0797]
MDTDVETVLPLLLTTNASTSSEELPKLRTALLMMSSKIQLKDEELMSLLLSQALSILEVLASPTDSVSKTTCEWMIDSMGLPLRMIVTQSFLVDSVSVEMQDTCAKILELLRVGVFSRDLLLELEVGNQYGYIVSCFLRSKCFQAWVARRDAMEPGVGFGVEFVQRWIPYVTRFDFGSQLRRAVQDAKLELPPDLAARFESPELDMAFDESKIEKTLAQRVTTLADFLNHSLSPQHRRLAFKNVHKQIDNGTNFNSSKSQKELVVTLIQELNESVHNVVADPEFPFICDAFFKLTQTMSGRFYSGPQGENNEWAYFALLAFLDRMRRGDLCLFSGIAPMAGLDALLKGITQRAKHRVFDTFDVILGCLELFDAAARPVIYGAYYQGGEDAKRAAVKHLAVLLELGKEGDQMFGMIPVMLVQTQKEVFLPHVEAVLESPTLAMSFLAAYRTDTLIFVNHTPKLLSFLTEANLAIMSAFILEGTLLAHTTQFSTPSQLSPIVSAFTHPDVKLGDKDALPLPLLRILSGIATSSDTGAETCTPILTHLMQGLLDAKPRHPQCGEAILEILIPLASVANFHAALLKPHQLLLDRIRGDAVVQWAGVQEALENVMNAMNGISLAGLNSQFKNSMKSLGIDPEDPFFEAVEECLRRDNVVEYDCMLSYCWAEQATVVRMHRSLQERGFSVWLDMERMAGNVYVRMCEAVLGSKVVISCMSAAYEESGNCKRELGFAADQTRSGKKIVPVRLDQGPFTWTALITSGLLYTFLGENEKDDDILWEKAMDMLAREISAHVGPRNRVQNASDETSAIDDEKFNLAVQNTLQNTQLESFDCMLSYCWAQQTTILRIRESLKARNLKVWIDVEQMAGNVYSRMSDAVLGSTVIVACLSTQYEASGNCHRELEFSYSQLQQRGKKLVALQLDNGPFTWSDECTRGLPRFTVGESELNDDQVWEDLMDALALEVKANIEKSRVEQRVLAERVTSDEATFVAPASITAIVPPPMSASVGSLSSEERVMLVSLQARVSELEEALQKQGKLLEKQSVMLQGLVNFIGLNLNVSRE